MFGVFYGGPGSPAAEFSKKSHRFFLGFRVIERLIRFLEQLLESSGILREQGNADAGRTDKIVDLEARQTRQRVAQPGVVRQILHQHNKFVAAEPAADIRLTKGPLNPPRNRFQNFVAFIVAVGIVEAFEIIDVQRTRACCRLSLDRISWMTVAA